MFSRLPIEDLESVAKEKVHDQMREFGSFQEKIRRHVMQLDKYELLEAIQMVQLREYHEEEPPIIQRILRKIPRDGAIYRELLLTLIDRDCTIEAFELSKRQQIQSPQASFSCNAGQLPIESLAGSIPEEVIVI